MNPMHKPIKCKFCKKDVLYDKIFNRVLELDGTTMHVENCERRKHFYKDQSYNAAEAKRSKR